MARPNELTAPLVIKEDHARFDGEASLSEISFADRRHFGATRKRAVAISLSNGAFEATYLASHADLVAIRDWTTKAIAALEAARPELTDA